MCSLIMMCMWIFINLVVYTGGTYKWIGHYMDHWSKFHVLFALCQKAASEVSLNLQNQVFSYLGTSKILHSDNGHEFVNAIRIVASLCKEWPGEVTIVNGHPRNPKCQDLGGNGTVEKMLGVRLLESDTDTLPWSEWLSIIQCTLLNCLHVCFFDFLIYSKYLDIQIS